MKQAIDAIDNGINQYDIDQPPRYVNNTNLSSRVGRLNLDWMDHDQSSGKENEAFHRAMELAGSEFMDVWFCFILEKDPSANWFVILMLSGISFFKQEFFVYYCSLSFERHQLSHNNIPVFQTLNFHAKSWLPARSIVMECLLARENIDPSKEIMVLTKSCPVRKHFPPQLRAFFFLLLTVIIFSVHLFFCNNCQLVSDYPICLVMLIF